MRRTRLRPAAALAVTAAMVGVGVITAAGAHQSGCHASHSCPSDHHTYVWNGLSCTSKPAERLPSDTIVVHNSGLTFWCHRASGSSGGSSGGTGGGSHVRCGVERWSVKTLQDPGAKLVSFTPRDTTVDHLRSIRPPASPGGRVRGVETTTFRVHAVLVAAKVESDSDIHLVIAQPGALSHTMIVEFPNPGCTTRASRSARARMTRARSQFIHAEGLPGTSHFKSLSGSAVVSGVGFFDFDHGQRGVAPNAIELHPAVGFRSN